jgi:hypothetical protein
MCGHVCIEHWDAHAGGLYSSFFFLLAVGLKLNNFCAFSLKGKLLSNLRKQRVVQWRTALNPKCEGEIFKQDLKGIIGRLAGSIFRG